LKSPFNNSESRLKQVKLGIMSLIIIFLIFQVSHHVYANESIQDYYEKCAKCHYVGGPHRSLGCTSCHRIVDGNFSLYIEGHPSNLINSTPIPLFEINLSDISDPYKLNIFCGICHKDIYNEYIHYAHGNTTFVAPNQETILINGYKDIKYILHIASKYNRLEKVNGKACVECHNPHDPIFKPPSILSKQSYRPPPPDESDLTNLGLIVICTSIFLVIIGFIRGQGG